MTRFTRPLFVLAVALGISLAGRAAPILPGSAPRDAPDEALSLAGLKRVRIEVLPLPPLLKDAGVRPSNLRQLLIVPLEEAGIKIEEEPDLPRIVVKVFMATDEQQPQALSIGVVVAVHQRVRVRRLDRSLVVPTATVTQVAQASRETARDAVERELQVVAHALQRIIRVATLEASSK